MKTNQIHSVKIVRTLLLGFVVSGLGKASAQNPQPTGSEVEQAIRSSAQLFVDAFNMGDAKAIVALWTSDGELIDESGKRTTGRAEIEKAYAAFFADHSGAKIEVAIDAIRQVCPDAAIEEGHSQLLLEGAATNGSYMALHVKQDGQWLMASVRESAAPQSPVELSLQDLAWLIGAWIAKGDNAKVEVTYDWIGNGNFIRGETTVSTDEGSSSGGTQIIGKDPFTGRIVSWSFNADGGQGYGEWVKDGAHWMINSHGATVDGIPTSALNILYDADDNIHSWQSVNRTVGDQMLPRTKEIVIERKSASTSHKEPK